jgi:hypothetical protein
MMGGAPRVGPGRGPRAPPEPRPPIDTSRGDEEDLESSEDDQEGDETDVEPDEDVDVNDAVDQLSRAVVLTRLLSEVNKEHATPYDECLRIIFACANFMGKSKLGLYLALEFAKQSPK